MYLYNYKPILCILINPKLHNVKLKMQYIYGTLHFQSLGTSKSKRLIERLHFAFITHIFHLRHTQKYSNRNK